MLIGISGLSGGQYVTASSDPNVWPAVGHVDGDGEVVPVSYKFRTPDAEPVGVEVTVYRSQLGVAPELFHYEVTDWWGFDTKGPTTGTVDLRQHDLAYIWNLGVGEARYDLPRNLLPTWRDANNPIGHKAVALRTAGPATWSVRVSEPHTGLNVVVTGNDFVAPEEQEFFGDRVSFVDATGGFENAPANANRYTTFDDAIESTQFQNSPQLIIIEDGQTHIITRRTLTVNYPSLRIRGRTPNGGATLQQDAAAEYIQFTHAFAFTSYDADKTKQFEIMDLNLVGHWDSTTETLKNGASQPLPFIKYAGDEASYINLLRCYMTGWSHASVTSTGTGRVVGLYGTTITNWQDYGMYDSHPSDVPWSRTAIVNSEIAQHPDALNGGPKSTQPWHNNHGPYRTPDGKLHIYASYFFARTGWFPKRIDASYTEIDGADDESLLWDTNACLRLGQNGVRGAEVMARCFTAEGGNMIIAISGANAQRADRPVNMVLGQFLAIMGPRTTNMLSLQYSGVTLEAFQAIRTGGKVISGHFEFRPSLFSLRVELENSSGNIVDPDALSERVRIRNWTYLNQRSDSEVFENPNETQIGDDLLDADQFTDLKATNYVTHATTAVAFPEQTYAPVALIPLEEDGARFGALEKGYRDGAEDDPQPSVLWIGGEPQFIPNSGTPAGSLVLAVPQEPSTAIDGADQVSSGDLAVYDLYKGLFAAEDRDRGAIILTP